MVIVIEVAYTVYLLIERPFYSVFTNIRLVCVELVFIAILVLMLIYLTKAADDNYDFNLEYLVIILVLMEICLMLLFVLLEHLNSWSREIRSVFEPCFRQFRLKGDRKVYNDKEEEDTVHVETFVYKSNKRKNDDDRDAFYARMLKKENLNKKYRRDRGIKEHRLAL